MYDDRFERQLAEWLEEGPLDAPDRAIVAAIDHARAHPRRSFGLARFASGITARLTPAPWLSRRARPEWLTAFAAVGAAAILVTFVVGGAALLFQRGLDRSTISGPVATPTAVPIVSATSVCDEVSPGLARTVVTPTGDVRQRRAAQIGCTLTSGDPRLEGRLRVELNTDERADGSADLWATATIDNASGSWRGYMTGTVAQGNTTHAIEAEYVGSGGYLGLRLRTSQVSEGFDGTIRGTISSVGAPPASTESIITGSSCTTRDTGTTVKVGSVAQTRGVVLLCTTDAADPRLASDSERVVASVDERPDESATIWGTSTLTNAGGMWSSTWTGSVEVGYTTHRMTGVAIGSGGYAGLEFRFSQIGSAALVVRIGTIEPAR